MTAMFLLVFGLGALAGGFFMTVWIYWQLRTGRRHVRGLHTVDDVRVYELARDYALYLHGSEDHEEPEDQCREYYCAAVRRLAERLGIH